MAKAEQLMKAAVAATVDDTIIDVAEFNPNGYTGASATGIAAGGLAGGASTGGEAWGTGLAPATA